MSKLLQLPVLSLSVLIATGIAGATDLPQDKRAATQSDQVVVSDAVIIQPPPGAPVMGAYLTIESALDDRLIGVSGAISADIQMHSMRHVDGKMQMRRLQAIDVPSKTPFKLERGGLHLMVMQPFERPELGAQIELTLQFERAGGLRVPFVVRDGRVAAASAAQETAVDHSQHQH
jgi:hypothetical protein